MIGLCLSMQNNNDFKKRGKLYLFTGEQTPLYSTNLAYTVTKLLFTHPDSHTHESLSTKNLQGISPCTSLERLTLALGPNLVRSVVVVVSMNKF